MCSDLKGGIVYSFIRNVMHFDRKQETKIVTYLEFRTMDKVQKTSDSECYTSASSPEAFRLYKVI
jgi:hypothetical protein